MNDRAFLGVGWHFPPEVDKATGRVRTAEYDDDIAEAIRLILLTRKGERVMRPDFGSLLHMFIFENDSLSTLSRLAQDVKSSLTLWEPRVKDIEVDASAGDAGFINLSISYTVRTTNNPYNMVFPFYVKEGSHE